MKKKIELFRQLVSEIHIKHYADDQGEYVRIVNTIYKDIFGGSNG
tara:strand:+ start:338 stop:472 length:135 start_codon:yes stop_codon:yes gene_type:complete